MHAQGLGLDDAPRAWCAVGQMVRFEPLYAQAVTASSPNKFRSQMRCNMTVSRQVDVAIIGAGTAGLYALREVRRAQKSFALIDSGPLGTTCARVGCMPSKAALHAAELWAVRQTQQEFGVRGTESLSIDRRAAWAKVRELRDSFAGRAAGNATQAAGEHLLMGRARFLKPTLIAVETDEGEQYVEAKAVIIAVGSRPVVPGFLAPFKEHFFTTDELFELTELPERLGVLGLGAIGLEIGLTMSRLGVHVVGADMADTIGGIRDPEVSRVALESLGQSFPMYLGAPAELQAAEQGVLLKTEQESIQVDKVLVALGRRSNIDRLELDKAGFRLDERGMPQFDPHTMKIKDQPVYIVGDANGYRTLMHEAADEGAMAGFNAARGSAQAFARKCSLAIAFTQPDIIAVGAAFNELEAEQIIVGAARSSANGRSRILTQDEGLLRIYADKKDGRLLGAAMVGQRAEHVGQMLAVALEQNMTAHELLQIPYYHPVVEEMVQSALQDIARQMKPAPYPLGLRPL